MEQNENTLSVLKIAPGQYPQQVEIDNDLKALQQAVGGSIGASYPFEDVWNGHPQSECLYPQNGTGWLLHEPRPSTAAPNGLSASELQ